MGTVVILTITLFAIIMLVMSIGVIFSGRCLRGSCGGSDEVIGPDGEPIRCATCPKRKEDAARAAAMRAHAPYDASLEPQDPRSASTHG